MTSIPASRKARAITFAPRSWPSKPGLATSTRIFRLDIATTRKQVLLKYHKRPATRHIFRQCRICANGFDCCRNCVLVVSCSLLQFLQSVLDGTVVSGRARVFQAFHLVGAY